MNLETIRKIYLIGICGTAMASLAGLLKQKGYEVTGSDSDVYPPMSTQLKEIGVPVFSGYRAENLQEAQPDLVIPGNAVPRGNPEVEEVLNARMAYVSMAEAIKEAFLREKQSIVVAGTHGKTTTTSMAAWTLESAGLNPSFLIGGVARNFQRSYHWQNAGDYFVIEGDEYDTGFMDRRPKFVSYLPHIVLLNAVEHDHADIYPDFKAIEEAFWQLLKLVPGRGIIIVDRDNEPAWQLARRSYSKVISFGFHQESDFRIANERWEQGLANFEVNGEAYSMQVFGLHSLKNAAGVCALGSAIGLSSGQIRTAFAGYRGVKRRMEVRGEVKEITVFDDFAHHPTAIRTTLEGARLAFPDSRIWGIFEPRSWSSRRNIFQHDFARAFGPADIAIIAAVYEPEKVPAEIRLNPEQLVTEMNAHCREPHYIPDFDKLVDFVSDHAKPGDKLLLMSNGSFFGLHDRILEALQKKHG